ncbi:uncharacterized protein LOC120271712 [Dioscorea cayenensis subsp. rotundata]|uniref:Uncharacterized protein LOC120271712 n=1 Tax=Dioscorea cayennensis subsp. rotundata TaxID=55577 RepID=A0AB40C743_DIOCR|nr:uncharacterized protein LOC120271712 [Dioscorea cayenensis subsp. rotundata]
MFSERLSLHVVSNYANNADLKLLILKLGHGYDLQALLGPNLPCKKKPSNIFNSMFISTASTASKMLISTASSAMINREGERWGVMDHVRYLIMLVVWLHVWALRFFMDMFPGRQKPSFYTIGYGSSSSSSSSSSMALVPYDKHGRSWCASTLGIGRSLSHMLGMLNEIPASSRKYEFMLAMADKMLNENMQQGHPALIDVNRAVLSSAFSHTWIVPAMDTWRSGSKFERRVAVTAPTVSTSEWLEAEKLAHELVWITNKLIANDAIGEAIVRWAFASGLAGLSLTSHPRVQSSLIKVTAMLVREMAKGEWERMGRQVRFGIVAIWLPLLCYARNGVTAPVLVGLERWELERAIEELIGTLPLDDQEIILGNWLEDFAASDSNWPNLQGSFERWCCQSRKLLQ